MPIGTVYAHDAFHLSHMNGVVQSHVILHTYVCALLKMSDMFECCLRIITWY